MTTAVMEIRNLEYGYTDADEAFRVRLRSLTVGAGDLIALTGPSGSGKSTLLDMFSLIRVPGQVETFTLCGRDGAVHDLAPALRSGRIDDLASYRRDLMGHVLQQGGLLPFLTVEENIRLCGDLRIDDLVADLYLADLMRRYPSQLSIGQRQRVSIARALAHRPAVLLADEPTASLDPITAELTLELLVETARQDGTAVIMANHDWDLVLKKGFQQVSPEFHRDAAGTIADFERKAA